MTATIIQHPSARLAGMRARIAHPERFDEAEVLDACHDAFRFGDTAEVERAFDLFTGICARAVREINDAGRAAAQPSRPPLLAGPGGWALIALVATVIAFAIFNF